jgi:outer membrane protein OmpA-like peptidoglycan-associated protein
MASENLALLCVFAQAVSPAPASPRFADAEWLSCSTVKLPDGHVIYVDQIDLVFFDSGSARIDAQGAATLDRYSAQVVTPVRCGVMIAAHTDRVGSGDANLVLSRRRAEAVAAYLRSRGLAPVMLEAFGETRPLAETADGVAEPQNRRVEIWVGERRIP